MAIHNLSEGVRCHPSSFAVRIGTDTTRLTLSSVSEQDGVYGDLLCLFRRCCSISTCVLSCQHFCSWCKLLFKLFFCPILYLLITNIHLQLANHCHSFCTKVIAKLCEGIAKDAEKPLA